MDKMKKPLILLLIISAIFILTGCRKSNSYDSNKLSFKIVNIYSGLGSTEKDNLLQTTYNYTLLIESIYPGKDIEKIKITPGEKIRNKILKQTPPEIKSEKEYIEIEGDITFDTSGLAKEDIAALEPYVKSITFTLTNDTSYTLPFTTTKLFK